jgi:hypothetical protein
MKKNFDVFAPERYIKFQNERLEKFNFFICANYHQLPEESISRILWQCRFKSEGG